MFERLFYALRASGVPVSVREYLTLIEAAASGLASSNVERFYFLSRATLVKDERRLDAFDRAFETAFRGVSSPDAIEADAIPSDWLRLASQKYLSDDDKKLIQSLGGWDALMEALRRRLEEQKGRHEGGSKWIGTGGASPFGSGGYNPEGVRIGDDGERQGRAVKSWRRRDYRDLDENILIGTRNIKLALRRLRRFARDGASDELDLGETIGATARSGVFDLKMRPRRRNLINLVILFDVGGSMDPHVRVCEELFSAARSEFKRMQHFYFHNCVYEFLWTNNRQRWSERTETMDLLRTYPRESKLIIVGDAAMSPYELELAGGAIDYMNEEPGSVWLKRLAHAFDSAVWLNPTPADHWDYSPTIQNIQKIMSGRMFPLTLEGLDRAITALRRS